MYQPHLSFAIARHQSSSVDQFRLPSTKKVPVRILLIVVLAALLCSTVKDSRANESTGTESIVRAMSEIESGTLLFLSENRNHYLRAPLLETSVEIAVQGMVARTVVEQQFSNNSTEWIEGVYAFPLPDTATVDELTLITGTSRIDGVVQPRKKARATYTAAKVVGKKASLLEQQRANLFTTKVANIPPGETMTVRISFQSTVRFVDGQFDLYFPLTITPRYIPAANYAYTDDHLTSNANTGWTTVADLEDAANITPPMTDIASPVSISVTLDTGLSDLTVISNTHDIITTEAEPPDNNIRHVSLVNKTIPADRDFKLSWSPRPSEAPVAAVFREDKNHPHGIETFASVMLMPPQQLFTGSELSREVVFVIDTSQSMSGDSIRQARRMLTIGIERLSANDSFNVLAFDSSTRKLFNQAVKADAASKAQAISWVQNLIANGGTEILGALQSALEIPRTEQSFQQIVFITDGSVGNESEIFKFLKNNIGNTRLFTVGIGSAPNTWFMRKSAELGRGTYTSIANTTELAEKALTLLAKLEQPAITDIKIHFDTDTPPEVYPVIIPDVYIGEPVLADARWMDTITRGEIKITGLSAGKPWEQTIDLGSPTDKNSTSNQPWLDKLWAYRKIQSLEDSLLLNNNVEQIENSVTDIALRYSMVTKYTSLVAVEDRSSRDPSTINLRTAAIPQAIPAGNTMYYPQGSLGTTLRFLIALVFALLAMLITFSKQRPASKMLCTPLRLS